MIYSSFVKGVTGFMDVTKYIGEATAYDKKLMLLESAAWSSQRWILGGGGRE
jgi:hypothetical protein